MATRFGAPLFCGLKKCDDLWDLVIKVKYNGTLKRFNASVISSLFDHNLTALRSKIASAFKFNSDVEFILAYTDEDGDEVMLDDENDFCDAAINQKLNPLRINVQLKNSNIEAPRTKHQDSNSSKPSFATPATNNCSPPKLDMPSSVGTYVPSKDDLYPSRTSYKRDVPSSVSNDPKDRFPFGCSYKYGSIPEHPLYRWIECDGCGATPIVESNIKGDYTLCMDCFSLEGNEFEYTRLEKPTSVNNRELLGRLQQGELNLQCIFISDITIPDGTSMAPSNMFTKIWRLRNSGCAVWPFGTQVIWVGGDQFALQSAVKLGISMNGVSEGQEVDVAVDFLAPANPGRFISYWRLALPSGKTFGQEIWVHIQVEESIQTSGNKLSTAINPNLPPPANSTTMKPSIDMNSGSRDPFFQYPPNIYNEMPPRYHDSIIHFESDSELNSPTAPNFQFPNYNETFARSLKESEPVTSTLPTIPVAIKQVQIPTTDHRASSVGPALTSMAASVLAPETIPLPKFVGFFYPSVPAPTSLPVQTPTSVPTTGLPDVTVNHKEEKLLRELIELGFGQAHLNKEILQLNKYDLEHYVRDLCGLGDWDPLHGELCLNWDSMTLR